MNELNEQNELNGLNKLNELNEWTKWTYLTKWTKWYAYINELYQATRQTKVLCSIINNWNLICIELCRNLDVT